MSTAVSSPRFPVGTKYTLRSKSRRGEPVIGTVTDIWFTYNSAKEVVKFRYCATHEFCGQLVTETDIVETTIAIGAAALSAECAA